MSGSITQFVPVDLLGIEQISTPAPASGIITVTTGEVPAGYFWQVERVVITCTSTASTTFALYKGSIVPIHLRAVSLIGNQAIADGEPPLRVGPGYSLTGLWSGADPGSIATLVIEGLLVQRVQLGATSLTAG